MVVFHSSRWVDIWSLLAWLFHWVDPTEAAFDQRAKKKRSDSAQIEKCNLAVTFSVWFQPVRDSFLKSQHPYWIASTKASSYAPGDLWIRGFQIVPNFAGFFFVEIHPRSSPCLTPISLVKWIALKAEILCTKPIIFWRIVATHWNESLCPEIWTSILQILQDKCSFRLDMSILLQDR